MRIDSTVETPVGADETVFEQILNEVSRRTETDPTALPAFSDTVDADALERLYHRASGPVVVTFEYAGCQVHVDTEGGVTVYQEDG